MSQTIKLTTPISEETVRSLKAGDIVMLSGVIYTGRDAAHKRLCAMLDNQEKLPVDLDGQLIYFVGPCPAPPGRVIGSAGPTTSGRMDAYSPRLIKECSLRGMIGKGDRNAAVKDAMKEYGAPVCRDDKHQAKMDIGIATAARHLLCSNSLGHPIEPFPRTHIGCTVCRSICLLNA